MAILNYTTSIATEKTAGEIQKKLAMAGAQAVMSEYDNDGVMCAMSFRINNLFFRIPINIEGVYRQIKTERKLSKRLRTYEQASRIAWRLVKDWIEAQLAIIQTKMVKSEEVFLPYILTKDGKTIFQKISNNNFLLESGK